MSSSSLSLLTARVAKTGSGLFGRSPTVAAAVDDDSKQRSGYDGTRHGKHRGGNHSDAGDDDAVTAATSPLACMVSAATVAAARTPAAATHVDSHGGDDDADAEVLSFCVDMETQTEASGWLDSFAATLSAAAAAAAAAPLGGDHAERYAPSSSAVPTALATNAAAAAAAAAVAAAAAAVAAAASPVLQVGDRVSVREDDGDPGGSSWAAALGGGGWWCVRLAPTAVCADNLALCVVPRSSSILPHSCCRFCSLIHSSIRLFRWSLRQSFSRRCVDAVPAL